MGGLPLAQWRKARAEAATIPHDTTSHGDFYWRNILDVDSGVMIVDWEYAGLAAYGTDQLRLWSAQQDADDRGQVMEHLMTTTPRQRWPDVGKLALWLSLRLLGENLSAPRRYQRAADREHARAMVSEARVFARNLTGVR
jgi:thiamine kinase-like enzyme